MTGIYIFRWPNNAVRDISKIFSDLNAWLYGDIGTHLSIQFYCILSNKYAIMHVLSSCDIMVAQVVFCQNLCPWLFIGQENVLKSFWWLKDTAETCCPCLFPIFTMTFVILATLSQDRKLIRDKTLPLGFTKKIGQLDIAFQIWCSVDIFKTKYNKNNVLK